MRQRRRPYPTAQRIGHQAERTLVGEPERARSPGAHDSMRREATGALAAVLRESADESKRLALSVGRVTPRPGDARMIHLLGPGGG